MQISCGKQLVSATADGPEKVRPTTTPFSPLSMASFMTNRSFSEQQLLVGGLLGLLDIILSTLQCACALEGAKIVGYERTEEATEKAFLGVGRLD